MTRNRNAYIGNENKISGKENVSGTASSKAGHADNLLRHV